MPIANLRYLPDSRVPKQKRERIGSAPVLGSMAFVPQALPVTHFASFFSFALNLSTLGSTTLHT